MLRRYHTAVPAPKRTERLLAANPHDIARAAYLLRTGHTVAFPTETVYGLGANALNAEAVEQIFLAKQRPHWDPLIVHIADCNQLPRIATTIPQAEALIGRFWPGPLTLLLPRTQVVPDLITAGRELVGVRQPGHPVALELLRQAGIPIAAPSANTFSHTSPTTARHVLDDLDGRIDAVLDGGPTAVGVESTVVELRAGHAIIYRPGAVTLEMIETVLGPGHALHYQPTHAQQHARPLPSPGVGLRHYAPRARLILVQVASQQSETSLQLADCVRREAPHTPRLGLMLPTGWDASIAPLVFPWGAWSDLDTLAGRLFTGLRELDQQGATAIVCPLPEDAGLGAAIRDRLQKAAKS